MIKQIALKEFYNNLLSARFSIGFLICLALIPFTLAVNIKDYREQVIAFGIDSQSAEESMQVRVYSGLKPQIVKPPEPLSIFCRGISTNVATRAPIRLWERYMGEFGTSSVRENPLLNSFSTMDFCSILALVLSLFALLFTYDATSGERESGTLKLMLTQPIGRWKVLLGKLCGVCLTLLPMIVFCFLLSVLIIVLSRQVILSPSDWLRVAMLFGVGLVYFGLFMLIGVLISCLVRSSSASIVLCLFAWVFFSFIVPSLSNSLATRMIAMPSHEDLRQSKDELDNEFKEKYWNYAQSLYQENGRGAFSWSQTGMSGDASADGYMEFGGLSPVYAELMQKVSSYGEPLRLEYADKKWALQKSQLDQMEAQSKLAGRLALVSPTEVFRQVASALCRTNADSYMDFIHGVWLYRDSFISYLKDKDAFNSCLWFTGQDPRTFMDADDQVRIRSGGVFSSMDELNQYMAQHGQDWSLMTKVPIPGSDYIEYPFLNLADLPSFKWQGAPVLEGLRSSAIKLSAIVCAGVLLFFLTFVSFVRYDVR